MLMMIRCVCRVLLESRCFTAAQSGRLQLLLPRALFTLDVRTSDRRHDNEDGMT